MDAHSCLQSLPALMQLRKWRMLEGKWITLMLMCNKWREWFTFIPFYVYKHMPVRNMEHNKEVIECGKRLRRNATEHRHLHCWMSSSKACLWSRSLSFSCSDTCLFHVHSSQRSAMSTWEQEQHFFSITIQQPSEWHHMIWRFTFPQTSYLIQYSKIFNWNWL